MVKVILQPYNPDWAEQFNLYKKQIELALANLNPVVEHIGSTSVEGLAAKPIIDIQLGVHEDAQLNQTIEPMQTIGFLYNSTYEGELPFRRFYQLYDKQTNACLVNVHTVVINTDWWTRHLAFRDHLRTNAETLQQYQVLKEKLANQDWESVNDYAQAKNDFIRAVEAKLLA